LRYLRYGIRILMLIAGVAALYVGIVQGEWGETMFNATLL
jgi:hypothetical protein